VVGGLLAFTFGAGYFVVRRDTACRECGSAFSKERVERRLVQREVRDHSKTFVSETLECRNCGNCTAEFYAHPQQESPPC
jgi:uncharacterized Zn finger protein